MTITTSLLSSIDSSSVDVSTILSPLVPGSLYNIDIHPMNPTVSVTTNYRIIFTTEHTIPQGGFIFITLPLSVVIPTNLQCSSYLSISPNLACSVNSNQITISNGFPNDYIGSYMIGIVFYNITNPESPILYSPVNIETLDSKGYVIDQNLNNGIFFDTPAVSCNCSQCSGSNCWQCLVPSGTPLLLDYSCVNTCPSGYFLVTTEGYTCVKCHFTCSQCSSQLASSCTECAPGYYKSDGFCVTACPSSTSLIGNLCNSLNSCSDPCSVCSTSSNYCLQ